jgi:hypothetical protein
LFLNANANAQEDELQVNHHSEVTTL